LPSKLFCEKTNKISLKVYLTPYQLGIANLLARKS
jgi:hypothetical protein